MAGTQFYVGNRPAKLRADRGGGVGEALRPGEHAPSHVRESQTQRVRKEVCDLQCSPESAASVAHSLESEHQPRDSI